MAGRYRSETIAADTQAYARIYEMSNPKGTCVIDPGNLIALSQYGSAGVGQTLLESREMNDIVTPDFKKKRAMGQIINNPMDSFYSKVETPIMDVFASFSAYKWLNCSGTLRYVFEHYTQHTGDVAMSSIGANLFKGLPPAIDLTSMKDRAISKAWANIDRAEMFALASVAEMNQTLGGLIYLFKKVCRILLAVKRKELSGILREITPSELAEIYLNARYNLRPLYYDVKAIIATYNAVLTKAQRQTFRSKIVQESTDSDTVEHTLFLLSPWYKWTIDLHRSTQVQAEVRAGVLTDCGPLTLHELLGGESLVETAWDLLPFSFIIDWFINAGDLISSWTPEMQAKPLASWVTTKVVETQTTTVLGSLFTCTGTGYRFDGVNSSVTPKTATSYKITKTRIPDYDRPMIPTFHLNLDPFKLLDLGLILSNLSGFRYSSSG